jgi:hypothetical protein
MQPIRSDFTFRRKNPCPTAAGTAAAFEGLRPANSYAKGKALGLQPVANSPKRRQSDPDLVPLLLAELTVTASLQETGPSREPDTPPPTPPSGISKLFAQSTATKPPFAVSTESLSPEIIDVSSLTSLRAPDPQNGTLAPLLLSSSPLVPSFPLTPPRHNLPPKPKVHLPPKPKVHLPPTLNTIPIHETTTPGAFPRASDPIAHTIPSADTSIHACAAENTPEPPKESLEARPTLIEGQGLKSAEVPEIDRPERNEESSVDAASEGGSDGEWELVG